MHTFAQKQNRSPTRISSSIAQPDKATLGPAHREYLILNLHRTIGNQAVLRMLQPHAIAPDGGLTGTASPRSGHDFSRIPTHPPAAGSIRTKLTVNTPGDMDEREADRVSEQVMRMPEPQLQRTCACGGEYPKCQTERLAQRPAHLQTKHVESGDLEQTAAPPIVQEVLRSPGQPLDAATRAFMEPRFGHDFSQVRVHADARAAESAQAVSAFAYTVGRHIVFGEGQHSPSSATGQQLLAHELAHVTQQEEQNRIPSRLPLARQEWGNESEAERLSGQTFNAAQGPHPMQTRRAATPQLQRQPTSRDLNRPGAKWPFGPITKHKIAQHDLSTYILWVKEVERAIGPDKQVVLQRLRRLYYSKYSGAAGAEFDRVIADQGVLSSGNPPLDTQTISATALDGLYETNVLRLPDGTLIDVSHVLAGLDLKTSGTTFKADVAEAAYNVSWLGVVTWTGDLASWFIKWVTQFLDGTLPIPSAADALMAAQKVALLSDMDSQILAAENVGPSKIEHVKAERRPIRDKNVGTELSMPVSQLLALYYSVDRGREQPLAARRRFTQFMRVASPPIPHRTANADGSGAVTLTADSMEAIYDAIRRTARLMIEQSKSLPFGVEILDQHDSQLRYMAQRFWRFLYGGLATGDGPWP